MWAVIDLGFCVATALLIGYTALARAILADTASPDLPEGKVTIRQAGKTISEALWR